MVSDLPKSQINVIDVFPNFSITGSETGKQLLKTSQKNDTCKRKSADIFIVFRFMQIDNLI